MGKEIEIRIKSCDKLVMEDNKDTTERFLVAKRLSKKMYLEYTDLPKSVLLQRLNLISAKFDFKNNLLASFNKLNSILKCADDIIDGNILRKALKKMKKIFARISEILKNYKQDEQTLKYLKEE